MAAYLVGLALSTVWTGWSLSCAGDRWTLTVGMAMVSVGCCVVALGPGTGFAWCVGRLLHGLGAGCIFVVIPTLIAERCSEKCRGRMNFLFQLMVTLGMVFGSALGWFVARASLGAWGWRFDYLASILPALTIVALVQSLPSHQSATVAESARPMACSNFGARVVLAIATPVLVQLTGAGIVFSYGVTMMEDLGLGSGGANLGDVVVKAINLSATVMAFFMVDRLGRRLLVVGGFALVVLALALASSALLLPGQVPPAVAIVGLCLFVAAYAIGPGGCTWLVPAELLPQGCRKWGLSVAALGSHVASCAVVAAYSPVSRSFGAGMILAGFALIALLSTVLMACCLPETRSP